MTDDIHRWPALGGRQATPRMPLQSLAYLVFRALGSHFPDPLRTLARASSFTNVYIISDEFIDALEHIASPAAVLIGLPFEFVWRLAPQTRCFVDEGQLNADPIQLCLVEIELP